MQDIRSRHFLNIGIDFLIRMRIFPDKRKFTFQEVDCKHFVRMHAGWTWTETGECIQIVPCSRGYERFRMRRQIIHRQSGG